MSTHDVMVIMGSESDWDTMLGACMTLATLGVSYQSAIVSAHRTPERMFEFAHNARANGVKIIIAGAGGAAHLPGMVAALTPLPVIGVPVPSKTNVLNDDAAVKSILFMPPGIPVAAMSIGGAKNAAIFAAEILALSDPTIAQALDAFRAKQTADVTERPKDQH